LCWWATASDLRWSRFDGHQCGLENKRHDHEVDETYIKVKGQWRYLYRAVDKQGQTIDFLLSKNRDQAAATCFFKKAIGNHDVPEKITLDGSRASHQAVAELKAEGILPTQTLVRTNKYLSSGAR
jgi:transposase-like protein